MSHSQSAQRLRYTPLALAICLIWPQLASAQTQANKSVSPEPVLKEVVISGSRSERVTEDVPATIDLISNEQMERNQTGSIRDLINEVPNMSVRRRSNRTSINNADGREGNAGFNIRGLDGNRVLLLVDGLRAPRNYSFGAASRDNFGIGLIDRVEIVKGPSSALYGSDGIGGLVQFFTKSPETYLKNGKTLGGQASIGYSGEDNGLQLGGTVAGLASPTLQWLLSASVVRASELENMGTNSAPNLDRTQPNPQKDKEQSLLGKIIWKPNAEQRHTFTLESVSKKADFNLLSLIAKPPLAATSVLSANAQTDNERQRISWQGQFKTQLGLADEIKTTLSWQDFKSREYFANDRNTAGDQIRDTRDSEETIQANIQFEKLIRGNGLIHKLVYGLDLAQMTADHLQTGQTPPAGETFPLKRFPKTNERNTALFIQDEIVGERWSIVPALRWDRFSINPEQAGFVGTAAALSGSAVSPKLGGTFKLTPEWTLYSQWATGFKAPTPDQVNRFFENVTAFYKTIPNPNLRPEKSKSMEVGIKGREGSFEFDASVFNSKFKDFINNNQVVGGTGAPGNPTVFQAVNVQSVSIHGFEIKGDYKFARNAGGGQWSVPFAYGQTKGTDDVKNLPLNSVDPAKLNLGVKFEAAWGDVRLDATHRAAKKAKDVDFAAAGTATQLLPSSSTTLDLSGQWKIRKDLRLNASITNLTNKKYWRWSDVQGVSGTAAFVDAYSQPGRKFNVNLTADF
jgi:hemoglobin/transferrin/lactoferrin receptor protein